MGEIVDGMMVEVAPMLTQLVVIVLGTLVSLVSLKAKSYLDAKIKSEEYNNRNGQVERTLYNAVMYAESAVLKNIGEKVDKKSKAKEYLERIDPKILTDYGDNLDLMLDRKVSTTINKKKTFGEK